MFLTSVPWAHRVGCFCARIQIVKNKRVEANFKIIIIIFPAGDSEQDGEKIKKNSLGG